MKKIIQRSCIGCDTKKEKKDLIRIVRQKEGKIVVDKTGKLSGRGAYICGDSNCLERIRKTNKLERVLDTKIPEEIYEEIRGVIVEQRN